MTAKTTARIRSVFKSKSPHLNIFPEARSANGELLLAWKWKITVVAARQSPDEGAALLLLEASKSKDL